MKFYQKYKKIFAVVFGIFMFGGFSYLGYSYLKTPPAVVNPLLVKNYKWIEHKDSELNISYKYPETLLTNYMNVFEWPPKIAIQSSAFSCAQNNSGITSRERTMLEIIHTRTYCVTIDKGAAAGSVYTRYAYVTQKNNRTIVATFGIRSVQCGNYEEPKKTECEQERASFDLNTMVDQMFETIKFLPTTNVSKGGITGSVFLGPICPVMRNPPDPQCADKPYAVRLAVTLAGKTEVIKEFNSDTSGKFNVSLAPGFYEIHQAPTLSMLPRCGSKGAIEVTQNTFTQTIVYCDTGIR